MTWCYGNCMDENTLKLSGTLSEFPLADVIQFLGMTEKCGVLRIFKEQEDEYVSLYFKNGNLMHASSNGNSGIGVFYSELAHETGHFKFISGEQPPETSINKPIQVVLLEAQTYSDELKHFQSLLPPDDTVLYIQPYPDNVPVLNSADWQILSMVNGRRTIKRICQKIGDELVARSVLWDLLCRGLISDVHPDTDWNHLIPLPMSPDEVKCDRPFPHFLRTNLLLKAIDGHTSIKELRKKIEISENEIIEDIKYLYDTHWIKFSVVQERVFLRLKNET
ncbi:MAG: hypothetical protein QG657_5463 [Acidobacteriota bacterium]|nr:hypothetical protein [Acidobacteriota bacterium]